MASPGRALPATLASFHSLLPFDYLAPSSINQTRQSVLALNYLARARVRRLTIKMTRVRLILRRYRQYKSADRAADTRGKDSGTSGFNWPLKLNVSRAVPLRAFNRNANVEQELFLTRFFFSTCHRP